MTVLNVLTVPAFKDNYLWLIHDGSHAAVVDPGDAEPILAALASLKLSLTAILLTHHHADHIGGVPELLRHFKVPVFGPRNDKIDCVNEALDEGSVVRLAHPEWELRTIAVPGHTAGHIAYYDETRKWLFCGDTLFAGGCGRLFEGTPHQMVVSLAKLAALPDTAKVYCAHEYTLANLRFAVEVEPSNHALLERIKLEQAKRDQDLPTVPSTIGLEKATNPFLRYREPEIVERLRNEGRLHDDEPTAAFAALREWKNTFK